MGLRRYHAWGEQNAADDTTIIGLTSASTVRPHLYGINIGCHETPADQAHHFMFGRYTAAGTATSFTPIAQDPANPAALAASAYNHTVEPTYTANAHVGGTTFNQQATYTWETDPEYGLVLPATAANGIGIYWTEVSGGTAEFTAHIKWQE